MDVLRITVVKWMCYALHHRDSNGLLGKTATVHTTASSATDQPNTTTTDLTADWTEQSKIVTGKLH